MAESLKFDSHPYRAESGWTIYAALVVGALSAGGGVALGVLAFFVSHWFFPMILGPLVLGVLVGLVVATSIRLCHLRQPLLAIAFAVVASVLANQTMYFRGYQQYLAKVEPDAGPALRYFEYVDGRLRGGHDVHIKRRGGGERKIHLGYTGATVLALVELLLTCGVSGFMAWSETRRPFCTACGKWKRTDYLGRLAGDAEAVRAAFDEGDLGPLLECTPVVKGGDLRVTCSSCEPCRDEAPVEVALDGITYGARGKEETRALSHRTFPAAALPALQKHFKPSDAG